jgi:Rad3-related DNA helicase
MNVETVKDLINKAKCDLQLHLVTLQDQGGDTKSLGNIEDEIERLTLIATTIEFYEKDLLICKVEEEYYGKVKELRKTKQEHIYVKPTVVDRIGIQTLWPKKIKKVILLSATINEEDIKRLGLQDRRVAYLRLDSPIPPERRPFVYTPVASMAYRNRKESIPAIIKMCGQIAAKMDKHKGVIHCTYDMADKLKAEYRYNDRFWFHGKMDKSDRYNEFRAAKGNMIFVASGMSEGIDLAGDSARFQIITQLMRPNLGDRVNAWMVKNNINAYNWEAVREVIQQAGRICRGPEDFGMTFMLDSEFQGFYNQTSHLWPQWFKKAIVWPKG